jgi:23S rRNA pseudouridine955/2504/2580 synthase
LKRGGSGGGERRDRGGKRTIDARPDGRGKRPPRGAGKGPLRGSKHSAFKTAGDEDRRKGPGRGKPSFRQRSEDRQQKDGGRSKSSPLRGEAKRRGGVGGAEHFGEKRERPPTPVPKAVPTLPAATREEGGQQRAPLQTTAVQNVAVSADEADMRVDRFLEAKFPGLSFSHIQRVIRKGELRVDGKRVQPKERLQAGQKVRIPPFKHEPPKPREGASEDVKTRAFLKSITLHEDDDVMVLDKPYGLAVQGGSGTTRHIDGMLGVLRSRDGQRPRLVHRLDKDTSGCLLVAKTRFAAAALAKNFRARSARKIYWALAVGVPKPKQGRISTFLAKEQMEEDSFMRVAQHGDEGASHAVTYYAVVETAASRLAWLSLKPVTGRTHQLRAHLDHIGHPIVGDPKYFAKENWELPGGIQNRLHLLARRIVIPHPRGGTIDVTAPLPPHMTQTWNLLGFDLSRYDPIEQAPTEE